MISRKLDEKKFVTEEDKDIDFDMLEKQFVELEDLLHPENKKEEVSILYGVSKKS